MGLYEDLRQLSEQVKKRQGFIKGEEATKQALVLHSCTYLVTTYMIRQKYGPNSLRTSQKRSQTDNSRKSIMHSILRVN